MGRDRREDLAGWWQHLMNRGVARRVIFERLPDIRYFLSLLAWAVRAGQIELHAYAVLPNHFHLLVRSPKGELSKAMHWIQNLYAKYFNHSRGRIGPLFNNRFRSSHVDSTTYWMTVVRYIHQNPVKAGLCRSPLEYPYGSAFHLARRKRPIWFEARLVEGAFGGFDKETPGATFLGELERPLDDRLVELVDRRLASSQGGQNPLDSLVRSAPVKIQERLCRQARAADGYPAASILVHADTVTGLVRQASRDHRDWLWDGRKRKVDVWSTIEVGLLREACGLKQVEIALRLGLAPATIARLEQRHRRLLAEDGRYVEWAGGLLSEALRMDYPGPLPPADLLERWPELLRGQE